MGEWLLFPESGRNESPAGEYGLDPSALIFDDLTFTLATGDDEFRKSAVATIDGIRRIKEELPGVLTSLGVSNVSFGLKKHARAVLNSVFLHHCVEAGLDMAIVNPAHITPYAEIDEQQRALADDLIVETTRPELLAACEGLARFKRPRRVVVVDDSRRESSLAANQQAVEKAGEALRSRGLKGIRHFTPEDAAVLADSLTQRLPQHESGIRFLLDRRGREAEVTTGITRSIAQLLSTGHPLLVFDAREPGVMDRVHHAGEEIVRAYLASKAEI